ncbi:MAG TPA: TonB-dependent receptor plug domain-containing protein [Opitutus sp.]|nr:TonB-dependent receptor plug domain-containing protein [Opitutus sp.]
MDAPSKPHAATKPAYLYRIATVLAGLALAGNPGWAQTTSGASSGSDDENVTTLSPFEVRSEQDHGYAATSTLAGTRLNSKLSDLAASISVVTKDFMTDVNATDLSSLLIYTVGTEVGGPEGNYSGLSSPEAGGEFNDALGQAKPGTRVRGLIDADTARDFFQSDIPLDSYNIDRVDISRGANSILFGLGSPAGIINSGLIKARTDKTATTVTAAVDDYHSARATLDHNQVLIKDKLALRLAGVWDEARYRIEDAGEMKRAFTLTGTYRPFQSTTIRVTAEQGKDDSNRPEMRPPWDQYSWWWAAGQPVWNPTTNTGHLLGTPSGPFTASTVFNADGTRSSATGGLLLTANIGNWRSNQLGLIYQDPNNAQFGGVDVGGGQSVDAIEGFADRAYLSNDGTTLVNGGIVGLNTWTQINKGLIHAGDPLAGLYNRDPQVTDPNVFDFYHHSLTGPIKYEWSRWSAYNASIEQTFLHETAGIELAFDKETLDYGYTSPLDYRVNLDVNEVLPNGAPNPNFLRPVTEGGGFKRIYSEDRKAYRATGFYQLDFRDKGPQWLGYIFGHHMIQANFMSQDHYHEKLGGTVANNNFDYRVAEGQTLPGSLSSTARQIAVVHYLGDSVLGTSSVADGTFQGITAFQDPGGHDDMITLYNPRPATTSPADFAPWKVQTFSLLTNGREDLNNAIRAAAGYADRTRQKVESTSGAVQSYWLDGVVVSTVGVRHDHVRNYDAGIAQQNALGGAILDPDVFYPKLVRDISDDSSSWGVVVHTPSFIAKHVPFGADLSVFYNSSSNFRVGAQRYSVTGVALPSEAGDTKEYGVRLSVGDGMFDFKWAHYETVADNASVGNLDGAIGQLALMIPNTIDRNYLGDNADNPQGIADFENWLKGPYGQVYSNAFHLQLVDNTDPTLPKTTYGSYADSTDDRGQISAVSALKSTGNEFELTFNPTRNWRIAANAASAEAVRTNVAPELYDFIFNPNGGIVGLVQNPDGTTSAAGALRGTASGSTTMQSFVISNILNNGIITTFAQEGTKSDELRKWNYRLVTNYTFDENQFGGKLKGFGVGGAVRWSDKPLIGYGGTMLTIGGGSVAVSDVNQPIYGKQETTFDLWFSYTHRLTKRIDWKAQLNIRNVGVGNELLPVQANPDGQVQVWRIRDPQRITLTNTFEF